MSWSEVLDYFKNMEEMKDIERIDSILKGGSLLARDSNKTPLLKFKPHFLGELLNQKSSICTQSGRNISEFI